MVTTAPRFAPAGSQASNRVSFAISVNSNWSKPKFTTPSQRTSAPICTMCRPRISAKLGPPSKAGARAALSAVKNPAMVIDYEAQGRMQYTCDLNFDRPGNPLLLMS